MAREAKIVTPGHHWYQKTKARGPSKYPAMPDSASKQLLILYDPRAAFVDTTFRYLDSFRQYSRFNITYFDINARPNPPANFSRYDAVWVNYCARLAFPDCEWEAIKDSLIAYEGPKLVAIQDEYDNTNGLRAEIRRLGFDVV